MRLLLLLLLAPLPAQAWTSLAQCAGSPAAWPPGTPETRYSMSTVFVSDEVPAPNVASVVRQAFEQWGRPGCSNFDVFADADAFGDPLDGENDTNLIGWYEDYWPPQLGSSTLAVTLPAWWQDDCRIFGADMAFNGFDHDWLIGGPTDWYEADIQAVATHEAGHWIGFDHNNYPDSTLQPLYSGGLLERSLTCDDTAGACALYPSGAESCTEDWYCPCGQVCDGGTCQVAGDDDDATEPPPDCEGPGRTYGEGEPNDGEPTLLELFDGDATITGTIDCANNGSEYTGDHDYLALLPVCDEPANLILDWDGPADLDLLGFRADGSTLFENQSVEQQGPIATAVELGGGATVLVVCWEGATTDWTLVVDWPPYRSTGPGGDDDDAGPGLDDDDATDDDRPTTTLGSAGGQGCGCQTGGASLGLLGLLPLARRRRR